MERVGSVRGSQAKSTTLLKKHNTIEVSVIDDSDFITVNNMVTVDNVKVINLVDSTDITADIAGNVVTINDVAVSSAHVLIVVTGS
jgi:hypothetical protein